MRYAITPRGIGKKPGARAVEDHFPPAPGETFRVAENAYNPSLVLSENEISLRPKTQEELTAEAAAAAAAVVEQDGQGVLLADVKADGVFQSLAAATPAQLNTFVQNQFATFTVPQRNVIRLLLTVAALVIRRS